MKALFLENYWIKKEIGRGNNSIVYEAVNSKTTKNVALKRFLLPPVLLESQKKQRFNIYKAEIEKYFSLRHESIMETYSFFEEDGDFFLEAELLEGKNLSDIIDQNISLKLDEGVHVFLKSAEALSFAHKEGLFHKFIKPSNIFVSDDGDIKITDFGTYILNRDSKEKDITTENAPSKSIAYFSPEQLEGEEFDARSEVYSLAAAIYHLFTGQAPFHGETDEELRKLIREEEPVPPSVINPNIPELLNYMLMKALNKDPELRHRDMDDLARDIKHLFQSGNLTNTGIRAGHIKAVKGRIKFTYHSLKQKAVDIFCQLTGKTAHHQDEDKQAEKKSKKITPSAGEVMEIELSPALLAASAPVKISERGQEAAVSLPLNRVKRKESNALLPGLVIIVVIVLFLLLSFRFVGSVMQRMNESKVQAEQAEETSGMTPKKQPIDAGEEKQGTTDKRPRGTVNVSVNMPDAIIFLQNHYDSTTQPIQIRSGVAGYINEIKLLPGVYSIRVEKEMCSPYERRVEVMAGQSNTITVKLERKEPRLQVFTNPGGASVTLNGSLYGKTPLTLYDVRYGKYKMLITKEGCKQEASDITIKQGIPVIINKDLEQEKKIGSRVGSIVKRIKENKASISIFSSPEGARVYLDDKDAGLTPIRRLSYRPGVCQIKITKKGYRDIERKINIPKGLSRDYYFDLSTVGDSGEKSPDNISLPDADQGGYYPSGKPDYSKVGQRLKNAGKEEPEEKKKIRLVVKLRFIPGVAYDKLDRKIITISFDMPAIEKRLEKIIGKYDYIELTDSGFNADLELKLHFAVGVNTGSSSTKPALTLYSGIMVLNFHTKTVLYNKTEEVSLEFPDGTSLEMEHDGGPTLHSGRYINTDKTTPEINVFLDRKLTGVLKEMKEYEPEKSRNSINPQGDEENYAPGDPEDYKPGVPPEDSSIPSQYRNDRDYTRPAPPVNEREVLR